MPAPKKNTKTTEAVELVEEVVEVDAIPTDEELRESRAERDEILAGMPELLPAARFRLRHKNAFAALKIQAVKSKAFEAVRALRESTKDDDVIARLESYQTFNEFLAEIDEWAESIAVDPQAYADWATDLEDATIPMISLFAKYSEELGE